MKKQGPDACGCKEGVQRREAFRGPGEKHFADFQLLSILNEGLFYIMSTLSVKLHLSHDDIRRFSFERDSSLDALTRYICRAQYLPEAEQSSFSLSYTDDEGDKIALRFATFFFSVVFALFCRHFERCLLRDAIC